MLRHNFTLLLLTIPILMFGGFSYIQVAHAETPSGSASIVVDQTVQASLAEELVNRVLNSWPWYVTRASGLVAAVVLILLMLSGIGFITGTTYRIVEPLTGWATHRALGIILTIALALHMIALYFDHFVPFSVIDLLVPFSSQYKPMELFGLTVGSPYVALGVISFYLIVLIVVVSIVWVENKTKTWKIIHLLSYAVMAFVFVHALMIGTDLAGGIPRFLWIALGVGVGVAVLIRLWRAFTL